MKDYFKLILVYLLLFASITLTITGATPPLFGYTICGIVLIFGILAARRHHAKYFKNMIATSVAIQLVFFLAIPSWILHIDMGLNLSWPYFPELLWTTGQMVFWYYLISFVFLPIIVFLYGRRAWCSYICAMGVMAETLGDQYRKKGPKATGIPHFFTYFKWFVLLGTIAITVAALTGHQESPLFNMIFMIAFIMILRNLLMMAGNIILMPKFGTRIWCKYFCPQGLIVGIISRLGRYALVRNDALCTGCGTCNQNCSMSINIKDGPAINRSSHCVGCGVCVELCPEQALSMTTTRQLYDQKGSFLAKQ